MNNTTRIFGVLFAVLGIICIIYPIVTSVWIEIIIGASLLVGAIFSLIEFPNQKTGWDKLYYVILAFLYGIGGIFMLMNPIEGTAALMIAIGIMFLMESALMFFYWSKMGQRGAYGGWILINCLITFALALLILFNINYGLWFIGTLVGIDLIFTGLTMLISPKAKVAIM